MLNLDYTPVILSVNFFSANNLFLLNLSLTEHVIPSSLHKNISTPGGAT